MSTPSESLRALEIPERMVRFRTSEQLAAHLHSEDAAEIGQSRDGQPIFGVVAGTGPRRVSVIAGCHADEPVGPMTAQALPELLRANFPELLEAFTFYIVPQMNPDGAERNRAWFGEPVEFERYLRHVHRELPGDDIEFGFGDGGAVRPECRAAQAFLRPHAPLAAHYSLHGMAWAEGAWCLIDPAWVERSAAFRDVYAKFCASLGVLLHDVERHGEKGFTRVAPGFCTTPNSEAMRTYFLDRGDAETAEKFRPSSMEWVRGLGGDPLCLVTELPLFVIGKRSASLREPVSEAFKSALMEKDAAIVVKEFKLSPMPIALQMRLQVAAIVLSLSPSGICL